MREREREREEEGRGWGGKMREGRRWHKGGERRWEVEGYEKASIRQDTVEYSGLRQVRTVHNTAPHIISTPQRIHYLSDFDSFESISASHAKHCDTLEAVSLFRQLSNSLRYPTLL
jgi:hypothetical protein